MRITQKQFTEELAAKLGKTYPDGKRIIEAFKLLMYFHLAVDNKVYLSGFGTFSVSHRHARLGVNPRNPSERITIPKLNTPKFVAGEAMKLAVKLKKP